MSESDSFITEVTDEVRRDQLYGYVRRYGWVAVLCILALVGGAAWTEYSRAQARAAAEATGDALLTAMSENDMAARAAALADLSVTGPAAAVAGLLTAASQEEAGDFATARATLDALAAAPDVPAVYRSLAALKSAMIADGADPAARRIALESLAQPGQTFALLAQEQLAMIDLTDGDTEAALAKLTAINEDAGLTRPMRERVQNLIVALGGTVDPATSEPAAAATE